MEGKDKNEQDGRKNLRRKETEKGKNECKKDKYEHLRIT